jgi:hypothetical protein
LRLRARCASARRRRRAALARATARPAPLPPPPPENPCPAAGTCPSRSARARSTSLAQSARCTCAARHAGARRAGGRAPRHERHGSAGVVAVELGKAPSLRLAGVMCGVISAGRDHVCGCDADGEQDDGKLAAGRRRLRQREIIAQRRAAAAASATCARTCSMARNAAAGVQNTYLKIIWEIVAQTSRLKLFHNLFVKIWWKNHL